MPQILEHSSNKKKKKKKKKITIEKTNQISVLIIHYILKHTLKYYSNFAILIVGNLMSKLITCNLPLGITPCFQKILASLKNNKWASCAIKEAILHCIWVKYSFVGIYNESRIFLTLESTEVLSLLKLPHSSFLRL